MTDAERFVQYEIAGSWWASWIPFGHGLIAAYFVWKVRGKMRRLEWHRKIQMSKEFKAS